VSGYELLFGSKPTFLTATGELNLASGLNWGVML